MTATDSPASPPAAPAFIADWFHRLTPRRLADEIDPATTAIFSTDMIVGFCDRGNLASPRVDAITEPVVALFQRAHDLGVRHFVLTQDTHHPEAVEFGAWPPHCIRGTEEAETIPELAALPFADRFTVIEKNSLHPAIGTTFDAWLDAHPELRTAIVVGNCTDLCVYQLAMYLRMRHDAHNVAGVRVIVPANAVDTFDIPVQAAATLGTMPHPGDFFHQTFLYHMALNAIEVVRELT
jgi:nicotinamidase-related amidase